MTVQTPRTAALGLSILAVLVGCSSSPPSSSPSTPPVVSEERTPTSAASTDPRPLQLTAPVVLLGEVHDNIAQHALRLAAFEELLARGARPALALEQLDRHRQPEIDRLAAAGTPASAEPDADALISAVGGKGWLWAQYRPFLVLALRHRLPIVAANVSREEAGRVMREGLAAHGFRADVPADLMAAVTKGVEDGHCGLLDTPTASRMALAQVARDQFMARVLQAQAARGVVLLAGNGHVRTDFGAPRWLPADVRARSEAIGVLEVGDDSGQYDRRVVTPAQQRPDHCEAMRSVRP